MQIPSGFLDGNLFLALIFFTGIYAACSHAQSHLCIRGQNKNMVTPTIHGRREYYGGSNLLDSTMTQNMLFNQFIFIQNEATSTNSLRLGKNPLKKEAGICFLHPLHD